MKIDLSKKPDGATHINPHSGVWVKCFGGNSGSYQFFQNGEWEMGFGCMSNSYLEIAQPEPWTGEGLPPVGTVCEIRAHKLNGWSPATIKFASRNVIVWDWEAEPALNGLCTAYAHAIEIRPIRTAEQIAEEARIAELNLMVGAIKDYPGGRHGVDYLTQLRIHEEACIDLYDAGWRKPVTP
jgi:hypothetical protein